MEIKAYKDLIVQYNNVPKNNKYNVLCGVTQDESPTFHGLVIDKKKSKGISLRVILQTEWHEALIEKIETQDIDAVKKFLDTYLIKK